MIFFGWGTKKREFILENIGHLFVRYNFFHVMFVLTVAWSPAYILVRQGEQGWYSNTISKEEATRLNGGSTPDINVWWKYSLPGAIGFGVVASVIGSLF